MPHSHAPTTKHLITKKGNRKRKAIVDYITKGGIFSEVEKEINIDTISLGDLHDVFDVPSGAVIINHSIRFI